MASSFLDKQPSSRQGVTQVVSVSSGVSSVSTTFGTATYQIRLCSDTFCNYAIGTSSVSASSANSYLPPNWVEFITVTPGQVLAVTKAAIEGQVTTSTGPALSGTLWVTELS
jgi:hypothetical protein